MPDTDPDKNDGNQKARLVIGPSLANVRLDKVLQSLFPDLGLRGVRRLWLENQVLIDGRPRPKGYQVVQGEVVEVTLKEPAALSRGSLDAPWQPPEEPEGLVVKQTGDYAALLKPRGAHSAGLAGSNAPSMEGLLPRIWPKRAPRLLNRLDRMTSGLLLVGFSDDAARTYHGLQAKGLVDKDYLAVVTGLVDHEFTVARALDTDQRKKTRVLDHDDPDPARHSDVESLAAPWESDHLEGPDQYSLVRVRIRRGARHQIRAHLAWAGHALAGDPLYGPSLEQGLEGPPFLLHHYAVEWKGFSARAWPDWAGKNSGDINPPS